MKNKRKNQDLKNCGKTEYKILFQEWSCKSFSTQIQVMKHFHGILITSLKLHYFIIKLTLHVHQLLIFQHLEEKDRFHYDLYHGNLKSHLR